MLVPAVLMWICHVSENDNEKLNTLLETLFQPLSKLLIQNEISIQQAAEILKKSLVNAATINPEVTDSHVSLKTGVHRKDVRRLRAEAPEDAVKKPPINPIALVLTQWAKSEMFQSGDDIPMPLTRARFDDLIRSSKVDLPPATVLSEMFAQKLIREDDDGQLHLLSTVYLPKTDAAALAAFDATVTDHLRVAVENTVGDKTARKSFDQALRYTHLSQSSLDELEKHARTAASAYLNDLNTRAYNLQKRDDDDPNQHKGRFVSGVYIAPVPEEAPKDEDQS
jgi:hypothetical protein